MDGMISANRMAQDFAGPYKELADRTVGWQERNVKFFQNLFAGGVREAHRRTEANLVVVQRLFEQAEEQREALQNLTENAMRAYWDVAFLPVVRFGGVIVRETVAPAEDVSLPIPGYSRLTSAQVIDELGGLSVEELKKVRAYEMEHKGRKALLESIEHRIQTAG